MKDGRANVLKLRLHDMSHTDRGLEDQSTKLADSPAAYIRQRFRKMSATHLGAVLFRTVFHKVSSRPAKIRYRRTLDEKSMLCIEWMSIQLVERIFSRVDIRNSMKAYLKRVQRLCDREGALPVALSRFSFHGTDISPGFIMVTLSVTP